MSLNTQRGMYFTDGHRNSVIAQKLNGTLSNGSIGTKCTNRTKPKKKRSRHSSRRKKNRKR